MRLESLFNVAQNSTTISGKVSALLQSTRSKETWRSLWQAHESPQQLAKDSGHSSPFFNIFGYTTTLGPLRETEVRLLIASSPLPFSETDSEWIQQQSKRWPILCQILCRERLIALESDETDTVWQKEGLRQLEPFHHLLDMR